jgi:hypothetical protein
MEDPESQRSQTLLNREQTVANLLADDVDWQGCIFSAGFGLFIGSFVVNAYTFIFNPEFTDVKLDPKDFTDVLFSVMQTTGLVGMAIADIDMNQYLCQSKKRLVLALLVLLAYYAINCLSGVYNLVFILPMVPIAYVFLRFTPVLEQQSGHLRVTEIFIVILGVDLFANGTAYGLFGWFQERNRGVPVWPAFVLWVFAVAGSVTVLLVPRWSRRRNESATVSFNIAVFFYLFFYGLFFVVNTGLCIHFLHYEYGISDWLFGPIHMSFCVLFPFRKAVLSSLGIRWLRRRLRLAEGESCGDVERGCLKDVNALITSGVDVNGYLQAPTTKSDGNLLLRVMDRYTLLQCSCWNNHLASVRLLLSLDRDAESRGTGIIQIDKGSEVRGWSALFIAARTNHEECVALLISHHADVNQRTADGQTPLLIATSYGHTPTMRLLIDAGAMQEEEWMGLRVVDAARSMRQLSALKTLRAYESKFVGNILDEAGVKCVVSWPGIVSPYTHSLHSYM